LNQFLELAVLKIMQDMTVTAPTVAGA